jgi:hypothetical protein
LSSFLQVFEKPFFYLTLLLMAVHKIGMKTRKIGSVRGKVANADKFDVIMAVSKTIK